MIRVMSGYGILKLIKIGGGNCGIVQANAHYPYV
jgi:hypothetical protein